MKREAGIWLRPVRDGRGFAGWEILRVRPETDTMDWHGWEEFFDRGKGSRSACTHEANRRAKRLADYLGVPFLGKMEDV